MKNHEVRISRNILEHLNCVVKAATALDAANLVEKRWDESPSEPAEDDRLRVLFTRDGVEWNDVQLVASHPEPEGFRTVRATSLEIRVRDGKSGGVFHVERDEEYLESCIVRVEADDEDEALALIEGMSVSELAGWPKGTEPEPGVVILEEVDIYRPNIVKLVVTDMLADGMNVIFPAGQAA